MGPMQTRNIGRCLIAVIVLCAVLLPFFPFRAGAQVSSEAERAFLEAKIRIYKDRRDPVHFSLPLLSGERTSLSSYRGKVVLLNFWATWCPPCRAEMPSMEALYRRFKDQGLEILAVDIGEDSAVQQYIQNNSFTFPVLLDGDGKVSSQYGIRAIPTTFIIDREGKIISMIRGGINWDDPKLTAAFDALLKSR